MNSTFTHPKDCADHKDAAADRKAHATLASKRQARNKMLARAAWFDWYAPRLTTPTVTAVGRQRPEPRRS